MTTSTSPSHQPRFVLYHPEDGVYLGGFMGLGFWSNLDPVGQPEAVTDYYNQNFACTSPGFPS